MRLSPVAFAALLLGQIAVAASAKNKPIPTYPPDAPPLTKEAVELRDVLVGLPNRTQPQGPGHDRRAHVFDNPGPWGDANDCDVALADFLLSREAMTLAARGGFAAEVPRLEAHAAFDSNWTGSAWADCEARFGPLYAYQPLAPAGKVPSKQQFASDVVLTDAQCDDLENRIAETEAFYNQWDGSAVWGAEPNAKKLFENNAVLVFSLKTVRRFCPAAVQQAKSLLASGAPVTKIHSPRKWTPRNTSFAKPKEGEPTGEETVAWLKAKLMNRRDQWTNPYTGEDISRTIQQDLAGDCVLQFTGMVHVYMSVQQEAPDRLLNTNLELKSFSAAEITSIVDTGLTPTKGPVLYYVRLKTTAQPVQIYFESQDLADRAVKALDHLLELCGSRAAKEAF